METRPSPSRRRSFALSLIAILAALLALAAARSFASDDSPGAGWVRVGTVQEVRGQGVTLATDVPAYVVIGPPQTPVTFLARSPHLGERVVYCPSSMWFEDPPTETSSTDLGTTCSGLLRGVSIGWRPWFRTAWFG